MSSLIKGSQIRPATITQSNLNLVTPAAANDAVTLSFLTTSLVTNRASLGIKDAVIVATTANITLSGLQTIDGVTLTANQRVLVKNQTTGSQNGIYLSNSGAWTRSTDANTSSNLLPNILVPVSTGTISADTVFALTTDAPITVDTTSLTFTQFGTGSSPVTASGVLLKTANDIALQFGNTLRNNAGLLDNKFKDVSVSSDTNGVFAAVPFNILSVASITTANGQLATSTTLVKTPIGAIKVGVNVGNNVTLGNGVKTTDCYFSADGGATAKTFATIAAGDSLYWNGSIVGYQLDANDTVIFDFNAYL